MCGICGVLELDSAVRVERSVLQAMNERIHHRGPDDEGYFTSGNVGLAMRRLSIIDVATGRQPISNEDGSVTIVFNGEIYNYLELRSRLQSRGHQFATHSDTETIVHLYEEYGADCVHHLRGMFAFALWDANERSLFLARDRLGIKPFYYAANGERLLFGSEIKALLAHPGMHAALDTAALPEYLAFGYLAGQGTLFRGVEELAPGHTMRIDAEGRVDATRYWSLPDPDGARGSHADYVRGYRQLLEECVESHLMSEVPLGVFLSGGLDSSTIAAITKRQVDGPVETFSVGYDAPESELGYARTVAEHLGTTHHEITIGASDFFDALPLVVWHEDKPLMGSASIALYFVARLARQHVTVVLSGEGSDETLGGYTRYPWSTWNARFNGVYGRLVPAALRRALRTKIAGSGALSADMRRRLQHSFLGRDLSKWPDWYFEEFYVGITEAEQSQMLRPALRPRPGAALEDAVGLVRDVGGDTIKSLLYADISTYLVELLMKQDKMSMAASVESRVPFLDHELVEFAARIPSRHNVRGLAGKRVLKEGVQDLLPRSIIHRTKKGFPTPLRAWLRGPALEAAEETLLSTRSLDRGIFERSALVETFAEQRAMRRDHTDRIWRLLNLEIWCRVFLDEEPVEAKPLPPSRSTRSPALSG